VKPNEGTVEQNIVAIGAFTDDAKCVIALSLEYVIIALDITYKVSNNDNLPTKSYK
jgi:hypothetical protein